MPPNRLTAFGSGPSPLTRGNHAGSGQAADDLGSIPAHAGQPSRSGTACCCPAVHPRSRGATAAVGGFVLLRMGPSPLTRGNLDRLPLAVGGPGSIPAHAGQPSPPGDLEDADRVHPRSRGATGFTGDEMTAQGGPSPLTRGNHLEHRRDVRQVGSIPAHAGQPGLEFRPTRRRRVHPRSRGATRGVVGAGVLHLGPSPLTRGNLCRRGGVVGQAGSIPAHAGQPPGTSRFTIAIRVHPRSRGATSVKGTQSREPMGPSPLTRGNLNAQHHLGEALGSIPAHAGQPSCRSAVMPWSPVHPRSRGATA